MKGGPNKVYCLFVFLSILTNLLSNHLILARVSEDPEHIPITPGAKWVELITVHNALIHSQLANSPSKEIHINTCQTGKSMQTVT